MNDFNNEIEKKIMDEIGSGRVKLRSKYIFLAEKFGLSSAFVASTLFAILFFNLILFYLKSSDNLTYLSFGNSGVKAFLESFPYLLVVAFIMFVFLAGILVMKADFAYKSPFGYLALILVGIVIICGMILTYTGVAERIEKEAFESEIGGYILKPFLGRALDARQSGVVGRLMEVGDNFLMIQTPHSFEKLIINDKSVLSSELLSQGVFIVALGSRREDGFQVSKIQVINPEQMPMVNRAVHRRFGQFQIRINQNGSCGLVTSTIIPVQLNTSCH